jgi:VanZ family protein
VPLAFLACAWIGGLRRPGMLRVGATAVLVFALSLAVAVAVEFAQIFFAPRTASFSDLLAEGRGARSAGSPSGPSGGRAWCVCSMPSPRAGASL